MDMVQEPQGALPEHSRHWTGMQTHHYIKFVTPYQTQLQEALLTSHFEALPKNQLKSTEKISKAPKGRG